MIGPSRLSLLIAAGMVPMLFAAVIHPAIVFVVLGADLALVALVIFAGKHLRSYPLEAKRLRDRQYQINRPGRLTYRLRNRGERTVLVEVIQPLPAEISSEQAGLPLRVMIEPHQEVTIALDIVPHQRGRVALPPAQVEYQFVSGWALYRRGIAFDQNINVYPDLKRLREFDTLRRHRALSRFGIHAVRMVGAGREFEQLRDYLPDDDYHSINWKATARRRKPVTNIYQAERSQDIMLCLDCGRMMGNPVGQETALDHAVDTAIMLGHVARREGDRVGLVLFRDTVELFLPPKSGNLALHRVIDELVDIAPEPVFPNYAELVSALRARHKRRSMVFIFTDLNDPQLAADLAQVVPLISRRHVLVVVSLRDPLLGKVAGGPAHEAAEVYRVLAARQLADERALRANQLTQRNVQVLEADADELSIAVINRYLEVKMRQLL